jgi:hypothetical protein
VNAREENRRGIEAFTIGDKTGGDVASGIFVS